MYHNAIADMLSDFFLIASNLLCYITVPKVKRIVYSTCSIHQNENEEVVMAALEKAQGKFHLVPALPDWKRRGLPIFPDGKHSLV